MIGEREKEIVDDWLRRRKRRQRGVFCVFKTMGQATLGLALVSNARRRLQQ